MSCKNKSSQRSIACVNTEIPNIFLQGKSPLMGIPSTNPMGWVSSPPKFLACINNGRSGQPVTELIDGIRQANLPSHRLDTVSKTPLDLATSGKQAPVLVSLWNIVSTWKSVDQQ